ncbi:MAG: hypothetical protein QOI10_2508 [Solirubrobacterales bacterium]|jgi:hypothetical protein|nr:hypothetical protein [Solirubrobacterales bacterium]
MKVNSGSGMGAVAAIVALISALGLASTASAAAPVGADGSIHGCYVAKGKHKGSLRLLPAGKRCKRKRHEKPIAWGVRGPQGTPGAQGEQGTQGPQGPAGASGISSEQLSALIDRINQQDATIASLTATIDGLTTTVDSLLAQVAALNGVLGGITNADLTGVVAKLDGVSHADLLSTVAALPALTAVCGQTSALTTRSNDLGGAITGLALAGTIPVGLLIDIPALPAALSAFSCPAF